jgi:hypothetical protein
LREVIGHRLADIRAGWMERHREIAEIHRCLRFYSSSTSTIAISSRARTPTGWRYSP